MVITEQGTDIGFIPAPSRILHMLEIILLPFILLTLFVAIRYNAPLTVIIGATLFLILDLFLVVRLARVKKPTVTANRTQVVKLSMNQKQSSIYDMLKKITSFTFLLLLLSWIFAGIHSLATLASAAFMILAAVVLILYNLFIALASVQSTSQKIKLILYRLVFIIVLLFGFLFIYIGVTRLP